ncbi:unnamed protein product [Acanthosepion pharaonis]|uniref:Uncharacterized protein n=1 Tax=Acanthosepion pharaonis TaxID=158019 RepID=A0A812ESH2_ACAPH|nr:unnamed protein product [Sepia pharaonis]
MSISVSDTPSKPSFLISDILGDHVGNSRQHHKCHPSTSTIASTTATLSPASITTTATLTSTSSPSQHLSAFLSFSSTGLSSIQSQNLIGGPIAASSPSLTLAQSDLLDTSPSSTFSQTSTFTPFSSVSHIKRRLDAILSTGNCTTYFSVPGNQLNSETSNTEFHSSNPDGNSNVQTVGRNAVVGVCFRPTLTSLTQTPPSVCTSSPDTVGGRWIESDRRSSSDSNLLDDEVDVVQIRDVCLDNNLEGRYSNFSCFFFGSKHALKETHLITFDRYTDKLVNF